MMQNIQSSALAPRWPRKLPSSISAGNSCITPQHLRILRHDTTTYMPIKTAIALDHHSWNRGFVCSRHIQTATMTFDACCF